MPNLPPIDFDDFDDPADVSLDDVHVSERNLSASVVYNTDWTVETLANQVSKKTLDLNPRFQRRDAWKIPKKSLLIESILLNFPVPPLTLAERGATKTYIVVDGKQRLNTLSQFFGLMPESENNYFRLSGLQQLEELNGHDIHSLHQSFPAQLTLLENYSIRTNVIRGWNNDNLLYNIFLRLNSGSVKLSPQELRQALKPGPYSDFLASHTENSHAMRQIFPGSEPDFRMRDLELMNRYIGFQFFIDQYRGDLKKFLDLTSQILNDDWALRERAVRERSDILEYAYDAVVGVFGTDGAFRKWTGERWENRLNRAVFDVMMFYLRNRGNIDSFYAAGRSLVTEFCLLCDNDREFKSAIESTTKSVDAVYTRLQRWGDVLASMNIIDSPVSMAGGRITYDQA